MDKIVEIVSKASQTRSKDESMDKIVGIVSKASQTRSKDDDDFADRLSSRYTVVLLAVFALLISFTQVCNNNKRANQPDAR